MIYIAVAIIAYLFGTFPSALFLVKLASGKDIRQSGTGNIGAMNSYDITRSKWVGIAVFILDALKAVAAVLVARLITNNDFAAAAIACLMVVTGHNFNIFLGFKGGRGLASAVGAFLLVNPLILILWLVLWAGTFFLIMRNVHVANATATVMSTLIILFLYSQVLLMFMTMPSGNADIYRLCCALTSIAIMARHISPLKKLWIQSKTERAA